VSQAFCRFCATPLTFVVVDLGMSPPSNAFVDPQGSDEAEKFYPLKVYLCGTCRLVQLPQYQTPGEIFSEYPYFSSYSTSWLDHVSRYARAARERFELGAHSLVIELASNDGHLLQCFRDAGIPVLGVEPARNVAAVAVAAGIQTVTEFFGRSLARQLSSQGQSADLVVANNVIAHVPDLNDFVVGIREILKPRGIATLEFPHVVRLINNVEYDTIYHEHFSYLSLSCASRIFDAHGLTVFDVDELPTHGGSLRIYAGKTQDGFSKTPALERVLAQERAAGFDRDDAYVNFDHSVRASKRAFLTFLIDAAAQGRRVAGYGAPAKATTQLNYCGVGRDLIDYTVDKNPYKQGRLIPGVHIPIYAPEKILETKPDYVVIFPWNIRDEVVKQMGAVRSWGGQFVVPIPVTEILA